MSESADASTERGGRMQRSRRAADRDAILGAVTGGLTEPFMVPYVLALGGSAFHAGLLSSLRNFLLAFVQLGSTRAVRRLGSRRGVVLWSVGIHAAIWLPLALAEPLFGRAALAAVLVFYTVGAASAAIGAPAWAGLIADYVPAETRGAYFGRRARLAGASTTLASAVAGFVLQLTEGGGVLGFGLLCGGAVVSRALSWVALRSVHDPGWSDEPHHRFSFVQFLQRSPRANFARFSLCVGAQSFATYVAAPYFAVYLLDEQRYSYATYTLVMLAGSITGIACSPWWGRLGDRFGNCAVLRWCMLGVSPLPLLWIVSGRPEAMLLANILGAFLWAGINLSAANFTYDCVTPEKRHACIAYFNVVNGIGVGLGAIVGGWIASAQDGAIGFTTVFAASAALRLLSALGFRRWVRETRAVRADLREIVLDVWKRRPSRRAA